ncbi:tetratricopeptide repeat protein 33-like [Orbicella faveolata]|uniref:tetratricopeptide repeat protein 33-like n=1 Tax=Orbicella faveolata TaxID=48498 RepID=UPI0009E54DD3|nr:tetratricopeptide repeat protein 33-like [Orbicella faveolata]
MATSFGWKRKLDQNVARKRARAFDESNQIPDDGEDEPFELDWRVLLVKRGALSIEDKVVKSKRLQDEGVSLAEQQRYWEAITRWNEAISLTPSNEKLYEMKSQILLELHELFPAIQAAEKAVSLNPHWHIAHQTLGRAQMGYGDVEMGVKSFSRAVLLQPDDLDMWTEDLHWAWKLRDQKRKQEKDNSSSRSIQDTQELQELYAEDLDQDDDFQALIGCNVKKEP